MVSFKSLGEYLYKGTQNVVNYLTDPKAQIDAPRVPFTSQEYQQSIPKFTGPRIFTAPAKFLGDAFSGAVEAPARLATTVTGETRNLMGKETPLPFNPTRIGLPATQDNTYKPIYDENLDVLNKLDQQSPDTPKMNLMKSFFSTTFNRAIVDPMVVGGEAKLAQNAVNTAMAPKPPQVNQKAFENINNHFASAEQVLKDPDMVGKVPMDQLLEHTKTNIVDGLKGEGASDLSEAISKINLQGLNSIDDFQKAVNDTLMKKFVSSPETFNLFRGENPGNKGGIFFSPDEGWAKNFGPDLLKGNLPAGSKVYQYNFQDPMIQGALNKGLSEKDLYKSVFDNGYDAIIGTDPMRNSTINAIINPSKLKYFSN